MSTVWRLWILLNNTSYKLITESQTLMFKSGSFLNLKNSIKYQHIRHILIIFSQLKSSMLQTTTAWHPLERYLLAGNLNLTGAPPSVNLTSNLQVRVATFITIQNCEIQPSRSRSEFHTSPRPFPIRMV